MPISMMADMYKEEFANFDSFIKAAETRKSAIQDDNRSSHAYGDYSFHGTYTFDEALNLAKSGWTEGAKQVKRLTEAMYDKLSARTFKATPMWEVEGGMLDVGTYLTGQPECFLVERETDEIQESPSKKVLRMAVNCGANGGITAQDMFVRGAAILAFIDLMEHMGRRIELDVVFGNRSHLQVNDSLEANVAHSVRVKDADQEMNFDQLAFVLCHAGMFRRLLWSVRECMQNAYQHGYHLGRGGGYGLAVNYRPQNADMVLNSTMGAMKEIIEDPEAWIREKLQEQGITLTEE